LKSPTNGLIDFWTEACNNKIGEGKQSAAGNEKWANKLESSRSNMPISDDPSIVCGGCYFRENA
jgi:hypothetical protein